MKSRQFKYSIMPFLWLQVQAERAAWELATELGIDLVTINPTMITGPVTNTRGGFSVDSIKVQL